MNENEKDQFLDWMEVEQNYQLDKYENNLTSWDNTLKVHYDIKEFWERQVTQYYDRAAIFLDEALKLKFTANPEDQERRRKLELMAQQAVGKAALTAQALAWAMIRSFGEMPKPGVSSGIIEPWHPICPKCEKEVDEQNDAWFRNAGSGHTYHVGCATPLE